MVYGRLVRRSFPRYGLRLLLAVVTVVSILFALYREPLREGVVALGKRLRGLFVAESHGTLAKRRIVIMGPRTFGAPAALPPPSPDEIASALRSARLFTGANLRIVMEPISEYLDPPASTPAQLHHAHYKCMIFSDAGVWTIFVDHNHWCVP